jgi:2-oxoglutarate dehydrogenase E2 component (dihydrolipoamide succinyltransferase)
MPALGESVTEGTVTRWLKRVGDTVEADEPLLEVSTDKVDTEIPSPVAGTVLEITVDEDQTVEVGAQLARIGDAKAQAPTAQAPTAQAPAAPAAPEQTRPRGESGWSPPEATDTDQPPPRPALTPREPAPQAGAERRAEAPAGTGNGGTQRAATPQPPAEADGQLGAAPYVTPLVRKLAAEHNVDLSGISGTGVGGRIRKHDVLAAAEAAKAVPQPRATPQPEPAASGAQPAGAGAPTRAAGAASSALRGRTEKMSRLRQVIAKRMVESLQTSAQLTTVLEVDVTRIARLRDRAKRDFEAREGVKLSFLPFFAKTAVEALKQHPQLNASINSETSEVTYHGAEHLGMAVDTERGLLVPVIHDAGDLNIAGLARRIADLAERTRNNKVTPDELSGGTFTLTNTGSRGALFDTPIINQPQVAILGTGAVVKRPVVLPGDAGDTIAIRSMMYLALSYDHRLVDGADAARFLTTVKERLEAGNFEPDL